MSFGSHDQRAIELTDPPHPPAAERRRTGAADALLMRSVEFRKGREDGWRRLERLVERVEKEGVAALSAAEAQELPLLYRSAMSSLSVARSIVLDRNLLHYLENLAMRGYLVVYGPRARLSERIVTFFRKYFPQTVRDMRWHLAIAALALAAGVAAGYLMVINDVNVFNQFVPEELSQGRGPESTAAELLDEEIFAPWPGFVPAFVNFASTLFQHNTMVGILCFGLGFVLGIPTILLLAYNGLIVGAMVALHVDKGLGVEFVAWLSIHGVTEILAILLCGAAGLLVAEKILFPGRHTRVENLARQGRSAAGVVAGAVALFFVAGILEGGFRQLVDNTTARYAFGLATAAAWMWYFIKVGKGSADVDDN